MRYVSKAEGVSAVDVLQKAAKFQEQIRSLPHNYEINFLINIDQMRCQY